MQAQACDSCHRRKSRCDKARPACGYCQKNQARCVYTDRSKEPSFRKHHIEAVERRLRQAEAKNKALANELARSRTASELPERRDGITISRTIPDSATVNDQSSATENAPPDGDVMDEVTFLASTAAGERHYLGSTSGILFANLVRASVDVSNPNQPPPSTNRDTQHQLNASTSSTFIASKETLPSLELARKLVSAYLSHDHLCYPFLPPHALLSIVDSIYSDSSFYNNNAYESFVFDLVLAIATANVYKFDWQMLPSAETHHNRAMSRITEVFQSGGLKSLQAILLLCQYRTGSSMQDTSASMWHLVGIAVRISFELGLHRESTYTLKQRRQEAERVEALRDQETRRRCFWCVFAMDRIVGITLGRPLAIHLDDIDVELPSPESDYVFATPLEPHEDTSPINRTAIFVHITEYRLLCGKIIRSLHGLKRPGHDETRIISPRDSLVADLDSWRQNTGSLGLSTMSQDRSSFRSHEWYEMLYCNAMLFLFRPSPMLSDITRDSSSLKNIFSSAKQAITLYAYLHRSRKINYSWITLHSVFMAGLSYIYAVSRHFRERRRGSRGGSLLASDPSAIEIVNDTRACSNVLVAVSERWNALRHCHEVFDRLSDAVLADAIKLQCAPNLPESVAAAQSLPTPISTQPANSGSNLISTSSNSSMRNEPSIPMNSGFYSGTSPLAVDSEFRSCFDDLQNLYNQSYVDDPVMQLSQDWLGYIDGFNSMMTPMMPDQYTGANY